MSTPDHPVTGALGGRISRRVLLASGVTAAAGAWLLGPAVLGGPRNALARLAAASAPTSVAYVPGATTLAEAIGRRAVPASVLRRAGGGLEGGSVRITVEGLASEAAAEGDEGLRHIHLDALFAASDDRAGDPAAFYAWTLRKDRRVTASGRVSFPWSVGSAPTLGLRLVVGHAATGTGEAPGQDGLHVSSHVSIFSDGEEPGAVPLREGLYLLGLGPGAWHAPATVPAPDDRAWRRRQSLAVTVQRVGA